MHSVNPRLFTFVAGSSGSWLVESTRAVVGESLPVAARLAVFAGLTPQPPRDAAWLLRGARSNERYTERSEKSALASRQENLGRSTSTRAALIPIRKNAEWWALPQDERRAIFEEQSRHTAIGLEYLPAIARRLHHCRDLSFEEPFDFLTWFEYAPEDTSAFDELVQVLRASPEWAYVDREVDIRLVRADA